jgi:hypothetical protein
MSILLGTKTNNAGRNLITKIEWEFADDPDDSNTGASVSSNMARQIQMDKK